MARGDNWNRANVDVGGRNYRSVRATIYDGKAALYLADGTLAVEMNGPIDIVGFSQDGVTWTNGTDTWLISKSGCGCRGDG